MEQARRRFVADCQQRAGGDAAVRQFKKDAPAAAVVEAFEGTSLFGGGSVVVWTECPFLPIKRGGPVAQQAVQGRDVVFGKAADPVR